MFGISDYGAFCAAVLLFLALPGPGTLALLTATGQGGFRAGAAATAGLILGDQLLLWLAVAGVAALLAAHPTAFLLVQVGGALYLGWIGLRLVFARPGSAAVMSMAPRHYARQALLITLLNPKAIVFYMAFFPLFIDPATHRGLPTFAAMAVTIAAITAAYCLALCAGAQAITGPLRRHPALGVWAQRLAGVCLIGFGLRLLKAQA
ncbi:LysE family transporter [Piscinibacter sakaiensis]|uniref:Threonine efflux protein n=1 Tax=Piscinibacter sakaiensis TaxID=1547922 RepID=A0A0K8NXN8_PISS1|nr:LysE family transporter [Piscinibacter sakaiensis]GAP35074.1 threonine efflux protein [Piscinibacter sakaiensis]